MRKAESGRECHDMLPVCPKRDRGQEVSESAKPGSSRGHLQAPGWLVRLAAPVPADPHGALLRWLASWIKEAGEGGPSTTRVSGPDNITTLLKQIQQNQTTSNNIYIKNLCQ